MIIARVQAHPLRKKAAVALLDELAPLPARISLHSSEPPSPWEGYKRLLNDAMTESFDHLVVVQDDVELCEEFPRAVTRVAGAKPDEPVVLFLSWLPRAAAMAATAALKEREPFALFPVSKFVPVVGMLWPRTCVEHFLEWSSTATLPGHPNRVNSDDACVGEWQRRTQQTIWTAVPSLVQHPDRLDSTIGRQAHWGADRGRTALYFDG